MKEELEQIKEELKQVVLLKQKVKESLANSPEGILRCEMLHGRYPQYYLRNEDKDDQHPKGRYLRKNEREIARQLAQRDYDREFYKLICKKEKYLKSKIRNMSESELKDVYQNLISARKILVTPYVSSDEEYLSKWKNDGIGISNGIPIKTEYETEQGEFVRSKSEKMIADKLFYEKIPYIYERALKLKNGEIIFPDFTVLNVRTRKIYYIEHFGMMDNPEYCKKAIEKMELYEQNQYYLGEILFVTFESSLKGINMKQVNEIINRNFR